MKGQRYIPYNRAAHPIFTAQAINIKQATIVPQLDKHRALLSCKLANNLTKIRQHLPYFPYFVPIRQQSKLSTAIPITHITQRIILNSPLPKTVPSRQPEQRSNDTPAITHFIIRNTSTLSYSSFGVYTHNHIQHIHNAKTEFSCSLL